MAPGLASTEGSAESRGDAGLHSAEARGSQTRGLPSAVAAAADPGTVGFVGG